MGYLIFVLIGVIFVFLVANYVSRQKASKAIDHLRYSWVNLKSETFDFPIISRYANTLGGMSHRLTPQTIKDVDIHQLFSFIDRTTSKVGQQFLFKKLIEPSTETEDPNEPLITLFGSNAKFREEVQQELLKLNHFNAYSIPLLIGNSFLKKPKWFGLLPFNLVAVVSVLLLSLKLPFFLLIAIFLLVLNVILHYWNKGNTIQFMRSIPQLNQLVNVSKKLSKKKFLQSDKKALESISALKSVQRQISFINFHNDEGMFSDLGLIGSALFELVKAFLLIEVILTFRVIEELNDKRTAIIALFDYVGNIDASISIAALRATNKTCRPVFLPTKKELAVKNVYHPLIPNCMTNSLKIDGHSVLITGSNMSGKSTFLRTITINSILSQTIYTCFADEYLSPTVKQFSAIRMEDNLLEGKSYYLHEINIVASLIDEVNSGKQNLFILDELFKGTNTLERISAAKAVLSYLDKGDNIVIVSTHDMELAELLGSEFDLYHFTEQIKNDQLYFDHSIKRGPLIHTNAIELLELSSYPAEITTEARKISSTLRSS